MAVLHSMLLLTLLKQCPSPESIQPCSCVQKLGPVISCVDIESEVALKQALTNLQDLKVPKLRISGFTFSTLEEDVFQKLSVEDLELEKVEVLDASFRPGRKHFEGLEDSLKSLEIRKSFKNRPLLNLKLDHVTLLNVAIFEDNNIPEVGNDWFEKGLDDLNVLIFERNGIETLGSTVFKPLKNLKLLAVAGNHINEIKRSMLPEQAPHLNTLDLAYNKLRELPQDIFSNLPSLQNVNFSYNLIHILQENIWSSLISGINRLHLEGNPLECDDKMQWMCASSLAGISGNCVLPESKQGQTLAQFCRA